MGVEIKKRGYFRGFPLLLYMSRKSWISVSLSDDVIEEVERRDLVKRSTYCESLIRSALGMEPEENMHVGRIRTERRTYLQ
jgi:metal-responsive CopG/Arc/MetJ family transcriptional regulator